MDLSFYHFWVDNKKYNAGSWSKDIVSFVKNCQTLSKWLYHSRIPTSNK